MSMNQVKIAAPKGWDDMSVVSFVGPEEKGFRPSILLTHEALDEDLASYVRRQGDQLKVELPKYKLHKSEETRVDGAPGVIFDHTFQGEGGQVLRQLQLFVGKGGKVPFPAGTDLFGQTAWREVEIPINPELLQKMSALTGGEFYRATDRDSLKAGLQKVLDSLERSKLMEGGAMATYTEHFHVFLLAAALCLVLEFFLKSTILRVFP